jgi:hypothetical protein
LAKENALDSSTPTIIRLLSGLMLLWLLPGGMAGAHSSVLPGLGEPPPQPATADELEVFTKLLGQPPRRAVTFAGGMAVTIAVLPDGRQQLTVIDLYLKDVRRMPTAMGSSVRISNIHLRGDLVAFHADDVEATYDYLWDSEEQGTPYWRRTPADGGAVTYSPNLEANLVAQFYLRDPLVAKKLARAAVLRQEQAFSDVVYIDGAVLILAASNATDNRVWRWLGDEWVDAGGIAGVVNHHGVADLNGDGLVEALAGDSNVEGACTFSWSALYTWNTAKNRVIAAPIRAQSASNLSGDCNRRPPACFREESLIFDRAAQPWPVLRITGTQDTMGCPGEDQPSRREIYTRYFTWDRVRGEFAETRRP